ncbi:condensation domain-containing protein, partial [Rhizobium sp. Root1203]|uniref:condensation domain-containing protein n=1 Tax=Rhizobium sp. Root1203 TaxID=1736427 RepID=UPI000B189FBD
MTRLIEEVLPLSPLQHGLLFHALYDDGTFDPYINQDVLELSGTLNAEVLKLSIEELLIRHRNLRAGFLTSLGEPVQIIPRETVIPWRTVDLRALSELDRQAALERAVLEDFRLPFDLAKPPLLRFSLVHCDDARHILIFTRHHIVLDGWSMQVFLKELAVLYASNGDPTILPPATHYRDFLAWMKKQDKAAAEDAWSSALADLNEPSQLAPLLSARPIPAHTHMLQVSKETSSLITARARQQGVTVNTIFQATWALLLHHMLGEYDVVFGINVSGRSPDIPNIENMVGFFINALPLRITLRPRETFAELLQRLQHEQSELMPHHHIALSDIQRVTGMRRLFETMLIFENYPTVDNRDDKRGGLRISLIGENGGNTTHYTLSLVVTPGERVELCFGYRPDAYDKIVIERLADRLVRVLEAVAADPRQPIGAIELLTPAERDAVLEGWNATSHVVPEALLPARF